MSFKGNKGSKKQFQWECFVGVVLLLLKQLLSFENFKHIVQKLNETFGIACSQKKYSMCLSVMKHQTNETLQYFLNDNNFYIHYTYIQLEKKFIF